VVEEEFFNTDESRQEKLMLADVLKATASALDTHTAYLTPEEAEQFMIGVQQRLFGIGVQLRDDISGFSVIRVLDGGPAAKEPGLKAKDLIVAVNGEPVIGMDIEDVVQMIRGPENTPVTLTVLRTVLEEGQKQELKVDVTLLRGEVVLTETRYKSSVEPFGEGAIAVIRLFSFYQDANHSSAKDIREAIKEIEKTHHVDGVILDLRSNGGGLLSQAVQVTGLFITKGIVVSVKDELGDIQNLRILTSDEVWGGPLIVLINRASASASEIVAGTLQDYGRALIVGDDHTFGKGSFQTFTLESLKKNKINPEGEFKVTRGRYYTVSGRSPQLTGVAADIVVPGSYSESEVGEKYGKHPLSSDQIDACYVDKLADIPVFNRLKMEAFYCFDLQKQLKLYTPYLNTLRKNSSQRILSSANYQLFLKELKKNPSDIIEEDDEEKFGVEDLQLEEAVNVMKDIILLQHEAPTPVK
jgi:C-terminal peptidase (prc)